MPASALGSGNGTTLAGEQHARLKEPPDPGKNQEPSEAAPGVGIPEARAVERGHETGQSREREQPDEPPRYRHQSLRKGAVNPLSSTAEIRVEKTFNWHIDRVLDRCGEIPAIRRSYSAYVASGRLTHSRTVNPSYGVSSATVHSASSHAGK